MSGHHSDTESDANWDEWEENETTDIKCLLTDDKHTTVEQTISAAVEKGLTNLPSCLAGKGTYCKMKIVNYIRTRVKEGCEPAVLNTEIQTATNYEHEKYLQPVLEGDAMLFMMGDDGSESGSEEAKVQALEHENTMLKKKIQQLVDEGYGGFKPKSDEKSAREVDDHDYYYGYGKFDIHMMMLEDVPRTASYRTALMENPSLMKNAVVIDVGCGSGILSMFAARGGAKHVIGIDGSERVASAARQNIAQNKLDKTITVHTGFAEKLESLPHNLDKADVIVSEWMGYCLLYESMLDSVLHIRDKYLKKGGAILPDICKMYAAGVNKEGTHLAFWKNVWGFDMTPIENVSKQEANTTGVVADVDGSKIVTSTALIKTMDLSVMTVEDTEYTSDFIVKPLGSESEVASVVVWFDTLFSERYCREMPCNLTTSPYAKPTHWHHTLFHLPSPVHLSLTEEGSSPVGMGLTPENPASKLYCTISISKHAEHHRDLSVSLSVTPMNEKGEKGEMRTSSYAVQ
eukprot:TRINITY_DN904_c9_g1_i1.p1 TRINITY_DN904_c9_g1~~TRINITY_DN904_c9_g1_i1.p1  ORF type:complete len:523 (+),score=111.43 TRINITY_DN904_c9_g1_i1:23-1570(+)